MAGYYNPSSPSRSRVDESIKIAGSATSSMRSYYTTSEEHTHSCERLLQNREPRSPSRSRGNATQSPFLRLPAEIRLQIYALLVLPRRPSDLIPSYEKVESSAQDSFDYDRRERGTDRAWAANLSNPVLLIRTIEGNRYAQRYGPNKPRGEHKRSDYTVRADRYRLRCMKTTYHCVNNPRIEDHLGILRANKQIHAEAADLLYSSYTFDFDTHVEAIIPFLNDLTPFARSCVKSMRFVKRGLAYDKEFDRAEWTSAMRYLTSSSSNIHLRRLQLGIVAGRPGANGWDRIATYQPQDFTLLRDHEGMQWMQYLLELRGLQELDVSAVVEHCAPATNSMAMANFIRFSASIESGFAQYMRDAVVQPCVV
ncbi:hypothetical protein LTR37_013317 [Vermiconidia calcicola]|uniref:Uncharacterized protein n=1 Tax=Vermiconidia calcicola TaxID=1690605 RepID=A0ACC3MZG2_9PEZI|nr:hypothetical protein LTR37_013317 [Vermiconidia calcicola]